MGPGAAEALVLAGSKRNNHLYKKTLTLCRVLPFCTPIMFLVLSLLALELVFFTYDSILGLENFCFSLLSHIVQYT